MEENIKFYSQKAIGIATFFGGPLAAGILIRKNFLNIGKEKEGLFAIVIGIVSTILLLWGTSLMPEATIDKVKALFPAIIAGIIYGIVEIMHGDILKKHKEEKKEFYSIWRAIGIGLVCTVLIIGGLFITGFFSSEEDNGAKTYLAMLKEFDANEKEAMKLFAMLDNNSGQNEIVNFINQVGIPKWKENVEIITKISSVENIPPEFLKQSKLLLEYSELRIEAFMLMSKAVQYQTSEHDEEIIQIHNRIDKIITELSQPL